MTYSTEPRDRIYVKSYGFLTITKNLNDKYSQKLLDTTRKHATDTLKLVSKKLISKQQQQLGISQEMQLHIRLQVNQKIQCHPHKPKIFIQLKVH